jgi:hypothetical protein
MYSELNLHFCKHLYQLIEFIPIYRAVAFVKLKIDACRHRPLTFPL